MTDNSGSISKKIAEIYEKYAPKNITLQKFTGMVERDPGLLDSINGEFSTFDSEIAHAFKKTDKTNRESKNAFKTIVKDSLDPAAVEQRVQEIAKIYEEIISSDDELLTAAWTFDILTKEQKQQFATNFINALNNRLNIDKTINFVYTDEALNQLPSEASSNKISNFIKNFISKFGRPKSKYGHFGGYHSHADGKIVLAHEEFFKIFMSTLSHEYGHFIDKNYPNLGMLGSQIAFYGLLTYSSGTTDHKGYMLNPTEISSYKIGDVVGTHLQQVLDEQTKKKPELYIKTLQSTIDMLKLEIDAKYLKSKLAQAEYYQLRNKIRDELYPIFYLLSAEEQAQAWAKIDQDPRLRDYAEIKKEYFTIRNKVLDERYPNFYDLSHKEQSEIRAEINQDPRVIEYRNKYNELNQLRNQIRDELYPFFYSLPMEEQNKIMAKIEQKPSVRIARLKYKLTRPDEYSHLSVALYTYETLLEDFQKSLSLTPKNINAIPGGKVHGV